MRRSEATAGTARLRSDARLCRADEVRTLRAAALRGVGPTCTSPGRAVAPDGGR